LDKKYNILICPLEWGLGHAARMIPLACRLRDMQNNVIVASGEEHLALFRNELEGLSYINFPGFKPGYSRVLPQYIYLLLKTPLLLYHIIREHSRLRKIIQEYAIDIVISDNRFGLWNQNIKTVYITHMPLIPMPEPLRFLEFIGVYLHRFIIKKYSLCFIPDLPGELNLSGRLSHGIRLPENVRYIGILSRFIMPVSSIDRDHFKYRHNTVILSGPEPQRTILKQKLVALMRDQETPTVILEGRPGEERHVTRSGNLIFCNHLPSQEMREMVTGSDNIITRSGYTTVMDLVCLSRSALLIPTPGQTEQEYLAKYLSSKGWFTTISQNKIKDVIPVSPEKTDIPDEIIEQSIMLLEEALKLMLEEPHK